MIEKMGIHSLRLTMNMKIVSASHLVVLLVSVSVLCNLIQVNIVYCIFKIMLMSDLSDVVRFLKILHIVFYKYYLTIVTLSRNNHFNHLITL